MRRRVRGRERGRTENVGILSMGRPRLEYADSGANWPWLALEPFGTAVAVPVESVDASGCGR